MTADAIVLFVLRMAMVALLYVFLAGVVRVLWADLRMGRRTPAGLVAGRLVLLDATSAGQSAGEVLPLSAVTTIGRAPDNSLVLDDEFMSGHHAVLRHDRGGWWLSDAGSTNGTWANGRQVERPVVVKPGDTLRFGRLRVRFES